MNADAEVMHDLGGPISLSASNAKFDRFAAILDERGFGRWVIETRAGEFAGYTGVLPSAIPDHPLGEHFEIGWRLVRSAWGNGYASEAAKASLADVFSRVGLAEVLAYTAADNLRSQAVMGRLGLRRDPARDFSFAYSTAGIWRGLVWSARP